MKQLDDNYSCPKCGSPNFFDEYISNQEFLDEDTCQCDTKYQCEDCGYRTTIRSFFVWTGELFDINGEEN